MIAELSEGFLLGLATGTSCLATCGPVYAPYLMQFNRNLLKSTLALLEISGGRFITYLAVGALAGTVGMSVTFDNKEYFTAAAYLLFSVFLLVTAFRTHRREGCCRTGRWSSFTDRPLVLGLLTGINFCPSFLLAITRAVDHSGPVAGMALFAAFFAGTTIFLLPLSFAGWLGSQQTFRIIARWGAVGVAVYFIVLAVITFLRGNTEPPTVTMDPKLVYSVLDSSPAVIVALNTSALAVLADSLAERKSGPVSLVTDTANLPGRGTVIVGQEAVAGRHLETNPLRKPGRFLLVLPDSSNRLLTRSQVSRIMDFLSSMSFKTDPDSGDIFVLPEAVIR